MPTVQELYELWAGESELRDALAQSLGAELSPRRPAPLRSAFRLADARAVRRALAGGRRRRAAPAHVGRGRERPQVHVATAESLPFDDGSRPGGADVVYVTVPTERLEPREADELKRSCAMTGVTAASGEAAARDAGLTQHSVDRLGTEWRESMIETGAWDAAALDAARGGALWGIYQMLGKLCPTVYVWTRA